MYEVAIMRNLKRNLKTRFLEIVDGIKEAINDMHETRKESAESLENYREIKRQMRMIKTGDLSLEDEEALLDTVYDTESEMSFPDLGAVRYVKMSTIILAVIALMFFECALLVTPIGDFIAGFNSLSAITTAFVVYCIIVDLVYFGVCLHGAQLIQWLRHRKLEQFAAILESRR